jgi:hypothetical protein
MTSLFGSFRRRNHSLSIFQKLDQSSLIKLVIPKSRTAANRELVWFLAATRTRSGSGELASSLGSSALFLRSFQPLGSASDSLER